ncbi:unnamed protein product, partial [marine sediment metagenome]
GNVGDNKTTIGIMTIPPKRIPFAPNFWINAKKIGLTSMK